MQQDPMSQNQLDISNTQSLEENAQNKEKSSELLEMDKVENTPFHVVGSNDQGFFIALGKYRISTVQPTKESAIEWVSKNMWTVVLILVDTLILLNKDDKINEHTEPLEYLSFLKRYSSGSVS